MSPPTQRCIVPNRCIVLRVSMPIGERRVCRWRIDILTTINSFGRHWIPLRLHHPRSLRTHTSTMRSILVPTPPSITRREGGTTDHPRPSRRHPGATAAAVITVPPRSVGVVVAATPTRYSTPILVLRVRNKRRRYVEEGDKYNRHATKTWSTASTGGDGDMVPTYWRVNG